MTNFIDKKCGEFLEEFPWLNDRQIIVPKEQEDNVKAEILTKVMQAEHKRVNNSSAKPLRSMAKRY